jgi:Family of unknown function (DUF6152)
MMNRFALAALLALPAAALAHHGWGSYDSSNLLKLSGPVSEVRLDNPHGQLRLEAEGKVWTVVLSPPARMVNRGLPADALEPGMTVTVEGFAHKREADEMRAERITVGDKTIELR